MGRRIERGHRYTITITLRQHASVRCAARIINSAIDLIKLELFASRPKRIYFVANALCGGGRGDRARAVQLLSNFKERTQ